MTETASPGQNRALSRFEGDQKQRLIGLVTEMRNLLLEAVVHVPHEDMLHAEIIVAEQEARDELNAISQAVAPTNPWGNRVRDTRSIAEIYGEN